ncbi:hypothetical protein K474DRAFT_1334075 [Panus rudis PR-1116 ss-1]|nr:hypothetical protein K474DRAFT_1334075 [Panus rudis PR-1116 ss-1]
MLSTNRTQRIFHRSCGSFRCLWRPWYLNCMLRLSDCRLLRDEETTSLCTKIPYENCVIRHRPIQASFHRENPIRNLIHRWRESHSQRACTVFTYAPTVSMCLHRGLVSNSLSGCREALGSSSGNTSCPRLDQSRQPNSFRRCWRTFHNTQIASFFLGS